jgi:hypothetical protein
VKTCSHNSHFACGTYCASYVNPEAGERGQQEPPRPHTKECLSNRAFRMNDESMCTCSGPRAEGRQTGTETPRIPSLKAHVPQRMTRRGSNDADSEQDSSDKLRNTEAVDSSEEVITARADELPPTPQSPSSGGRSESDLHNIVSYICLHGEFAKPCEICAGIFVNCEAGAGVEEPSAPQPGLTCDEMEDLLIPFAGRLSRWCKEFFRVFGGPNEATYIPTLVALYEKQCREKFDGWAGAVQEVSPATPDDKNDTCPDGSWAGPLGKPRMEPSTLNGFDFWPHFKEIMEWKTAAINAKCERAEAEVRELRAVLQDGLQFIRCGHRKAVGAVDSQGPCRRCALEREAERLLARERH